MILSLVLPSHNESQACYISKSEAKKSAVDRAVNCIFPPEQPESMAMLLSHGFNDNACCLRSEETATP